MNFIHNLFIDFCIKTDEAKGNYICVHCGSAVKHLMKTYSPTVLQLVNCGNCGNVADKYLEYDDVIIWIDIILLNKQAYRHVLFNTNFQNHWKLALLILIAKTADKLLCFNSAGNESTYLMKSSYENAVYAFCINFFITILGESLFFCVVSCFFVLFWNVPSCRSDLVTEIRTIWKAVISSSFGYFLLLPSLIWNDFQREIHLILIFVYTLLSHIQALTGLKAAKNSAEKKKRLMSLEIKQEITEKYKHNAHLLKLEKHNDNVMPTNCTILKRKDDIKNTVISERNCKSVPVKSKHP